MYGGIGMSTEEKMVKGNCRKENEMNKNVKEYETATNEHEYLEVEDTAGDEVNKMLHYGVISEICNEDNGPYINFWSDFMNDPLELIKLYEFLDSVENQGYAFGLNGAVVDTENMNHEFRTASVDSRFESIMPDLEQEINNWLESDDLEWVWDRNKWEDYKGDWYYAHGIHEYGKTPYCC